ncbi:MAG: DMT family transporter [Gemmatimonadaceae bacterium]|nr:DMT family transporter [Gemmatimonadaceae bacterium]
MTKAGGNAATWRATLLVALAACGFGSISVLMVVGQRNGLTLASAMSWRYLVATPLLLLIAGHSLRALDRKRGVTLLVVGGLGQVAISGISLYSLRWLDVATLGFLFYTFPAWVALLSVLRGLERVDARKFTALALALGGLAIIIGAPRAAALPVAGVACALGAAFIYAAYIPLLHWMRGPLSASAASTIVIAGAGIAYTIGALWRDEFHFAMSGTAWAVIGALALGSTVITFIAFLNGLAVLGPVRTAIISTIEPFYTAILGAIVLDQHLGPGTAIGGVLIAAAVLLLQRQPTSP